MRVMLFTQYRRPPKRPEKMDPLTLTESAGYLPSKVQIENLIQAGRRLVAYRKEMYDFPEDSDVDESFEDPTRRPGYDLADASRDRADVTARLRAQARASRNPSKDTAEAVKIDPEKSSEDKKDPYAAK